jgi:hypothetical protein
VSGPTGFDAGTVFGDNAGGCFNNDASRGYEAVFDRDIETFMDVKQEVDGSGNENDGWAGIALSSPQPVTAIRFFPRKGAKHRLQNGLFQGSSVSRTNGYTTIYEITVVPTADQWTQVDIPLHEQRPYKWVRYKSGTRGFGNVAEVEFQFEQGTEFEVRQVGNKVSVERIDEGMRGEGWSQPLSFYCLSYIDNWELEDAIIAGYVDCLGSSPESYYDCTLSSGPAWTYNLNEGDLSLV